MSLGARGERAAADYLQRHGYRIIARNLRFRGRRGEIDLIADPPDHAAWVIVEVKTSDDPHDAFPPHLRVNRNKQRKIVALTASLLHRHRLTGRPARFDIISVTYPHGRTPHIQHLRAAFESPV